MSTSRQNVKPDPGVAPRERQREHGRSGRKRIALAAAAVALGLIAASMIIQSRDEAPATNQAAVAADAPENTVKARAEEVATGFLAAFGSFDVKRAMTHLADDATFAFAWRTIFDYSSHTSKRPATSRSSTPGDWVPPTPHKRSLHVLLPRPQVQ